LPSVADAVGETAGPASPRLVLRRRSAQTAIGESSGPFEELWIASAQYERQSRSGVRRK